MKNTGSTCRSAVVALAGRPNSGKSTLLNTLIGEQLSVVTSLPQTTRSILRGIYQEPNLQLVFVDTPGIHRGNRRLNQSMLSACTKALTRDNADIVCYVVDLAREYGEEEELACRLIAESGIPALVVFNKSDLCPQTREKIDEFQKRFPTTSSLPHIALSAIDTRARKGFINAIRPLVPPGPPIFPEDELTDAPLRYLAAEYLRKHIILNTRREVPHATHVEILSYRETPRKHTVEAAIHVETTGQRGIIVGKGGSLIRTVGTRAARDLSSLAGVPVRYKCHVKVTPKWRDNPGFLRSMGYQSARGGK